MSAIGSTRCKLWSNWVTGCVLNGHGGHCEALRENPRSPNWTCAAVLCVMRVDSACRASGVVHDMQSEMKPHEVPQWLRAMQKRE